MPNVFFPKHSVGIKLKETQNFLRCTYLWEIFNFSFLMRKTSSLLLALGLFSATAATAQGTLSDSLQAYYPFTGNTLDMSGHNRHLFNGGATLTTSQTGTPNAAYSFDGVTSYMQLSTNAGINFIGDFTVCMKVKPMGYYKGPCHGNALLNKMNAFSDASGINVMFEDGYYTGGNNCTNPVDTIHQTYYIGKAHFGNVVGTGNVSNPPYATYNTWRSLVFLQKGDSLYQYVDDVLIDHIFSPAFTVVNSYDILLGKAQIGSYYFNGVMDELRIYNRALTDTEVVAYGSYDPLSVKQVEPAISVTIAPNPATDVLRLTNQFAQSLSFRVLNLQGVEVVRGAAKAGDTEFPVSQLSSGMYLLQVQQEETKAAMQTLRFVKQ